MASNQRIVDSRPFFGNRAREPRGRKLSKDFLILACFFCGKCRITIPWPPLILLYILDIGHQTHHPDFIYRKSISSFSYMCLAFAVFLVQINRLILNRLADKKYWRFIIRCVDWFHAQRASYFGSNLSLGTKKLRSQPASRRIISQRILDLRTFGVFRRRIFACFPSWDSSNWWFIFSGGSPPPLFAEKIRFILKLLRNDIKWPA